jgi:hypothetical protein
LELSELLWQIVGFRNEVEVLVAELGFHAHDIIGESVFASEFFGELKVVYFLVVLQTLVDLGFVAEVDTGPQQVPLIRVGLQEPMGPHYLLQEFVVRLH